MFYDCILLFIKMMRSKKRKVYNFFTTVFIDTTSHSMLIFLKKLVRLFGNLKFIYEKNCDFIQLTKTSPNSAVTLQRSHIVSFWACCQLDFFEILTISKSSSHYTLLGGGWKIFNSKCLTSKSAFFDTQPTILSIFFNLLTCHQINILSLLVDILS